MRALKYIILPLSILLLTGLFSIAQNTLSGIVTDKENGEPLIGATVYISGTATGTNTDLEGKFTLEFDQSFPIDLVVGYTGYFPTIIKVRNSDFLEIAILSDLYLDEIVVTASRKKEKISDAPAAVSVISAKEVSGSGGSISPLRVLINTPGVELLQQTGQRMNIAMRGNSGIFSTNIFPMLDYRSLISPGLEFFDSQNSPLNNIDVERVEVVRGPGSALYGPDVTTGVVHFLSKNPFDYPGTTAEMIYGERNIFKAAVRHAWHDEEKKFGWKINARYGRGEDFVLDSNDPTDAKTLENFKEEIRRGFVTEGGFIDPSLESELLFTVDKLQDPEYWNGAVNTHLYFRPDPNTQIVTSGGWNGSKAVFYQDLGEGVSASNEYWAQARVNHKGLFAQAYFIKNNGGTDENPTYLNRTGLVVPLGRSHFEGQLQYNFDLPKFLNSQWTTGVDYRLVTANTQNQVYGRNENNDDYRIFGGYVQGKFELLDQLKLYLAGRFDNYNFTDENTFSPRAALVYKPGSRHSLRLTYNRAPNPIPASDIYFDLPIDSNPLFNVWVSGGGNSYTFGDLPMVSWTLGIPGLDIPNTSINDGFPLAYAYETIKDPMLEVICDDPMIPNELKVIITEVLKNGTLADFSTGLLSTDVNGNELQPIDANAILISKIDAFEFGYKGVIGQKLSLGADVFYYRRTASGGFKQVSPVVTLTSFPADLGESVQSTFQPQIESALIQNGIPEETAKMFAEQLGPVLNQAFEAAGAGLLESLANAGVPFHGIVETEQSPGTQNPNLIFGYPTTDKNISDDWGFEIHSKYHFSESLSAFANYTWFNNPAGENGNLNFPHKKVRLGVSWLPETGFKGRLSYQWDKAFYADHSSFSGRVDEKSLVDAMIGYTLKNDLSIEVSATNLFDNEFRALPFFPEIGRTVTARVVYDF